MSSRKGVKVKYLVTGCTLLNDMNYADGSKAEGFLGGAIFTLNGIKPFCDDVLIITTAGPDFKEYFGEYYRNNGLSTDGVNFVLPRTPYNTLDYQADGRWREYSKYGRDFENTWGPAALIQASYIIQHASEQTRGIYFESASREPVWKNLTGIRSAAPNAKIMWELPTPDIDNPEVKNNITELIEKCDIYSINLPESKTYFGTHSEEESIEAIIALGKPCFFRVGEKGAYMIEEKQAWFAPSYGVEESVDPTGCGNCSTGTAMYGFCEGLHPLKTAILANLAASLNARQFGPYPLFTDELRTELLEKAEAEFMRLMRE
jgi:sugar/nucleoside kinase (ribokinase family)